MSLHALCYLDSGGTGIFELVHKPMPAAVVFSACRPLLSSGLAVLQAPQLLVAVVVVRVVTVVVHILLAGHGGAGPQQPEATAAQAGDAAGVGGRLAAAGAGWQGETSGLGHYQPEPSQHTASVSVS